MIKTILWFLLVINICSISVYTQTDTASKPYIISIFGGGSYVWNKTNLPVMPGDTYCGNFSNGRDIGWHAGIDLSYMFIKNLLFGGIKLSYENRPVSLESPCINKFVVFNPNTGEYVSLDRMYYYDGSLNYVSADLGAYVQPFSEYPLYFRLGFEAGLPLGGTEYTQEFEIQSPEGLSIPGLNTNRQKVGWGEINNLSLSMAATASVFGEFDVLGSIMDDLYLRAEIGFRYGINSIIKDSEWNVNILRAGVGLTYKFGAKKEIPPEKIPEEKKTELIPETKPDTSKPVAIEEPKEFIRTFEAMPLEISQTMVTQTYPLLPYIFYDSLSAELAGKYIHRELITQDFEEVLLPKSTLDIYYHILDIIGHRMNANPNAKITLTGTTDGSESAVPEERLALAGSRAESVAAYLAEKWNIGKERIILKQKEVPDLMTSTLYKEGFEENRRVEISTDSAFILAPVVHSRFLEYKTRKTRFSYVLAMNDNYTPERWEILTTDGSRNISVSGSGAPPEEPVIDFDDKYLTGMASNISKSDSLKSTVTIKTTDGKEFTKHTYLKISKTDNNFEVGRLNLIVFDFDKSEISAVNKDMIKDFIGNSIHYNSQAWIKGSTDKLGAVEYNNKLSMDRAISVGNYIKILQNDVSIKEIKGLGPAVQPYDNNLPEGRFYCRTVLVEVRTPVK